MFSSNETLEMPLWKSSSWRRMTDVFGLQCLFLHTVCVYKEGNTRPEGFKTYLITPPGYLSLNLTESSFKTPVRSHHQLLIRGSMPEYQTSASLFRQIPKILPFLWPGICQLPIFLFFCFYHIFRLCRNYPSLCAHSPWTRPQIYLRPLTK